MTRLSGLIMIDWLLSILRPKISDKWYGSITIRFENGRIVHLEEKRSYKPPKLKEA